MKKVLLLFAVFALLTLSYITLPQKQQDSNMFLNAELSSPDAFKEATKNYTPLSANLNDYLSFSRTALIFDQNTNDYFITVGSTLSGDFTTKHGAKLYWLDEGVKENFSDLISQNHTFQLGIIYQQSFLIFDLKISTLPFLQLTCENLPIEKMENAPMEHATITITDPENSTFHQYTTIAYSSSIKVRGTTSATFDKKSYKIELDPKDNDKTFALLGLRNDDDWNLSAVYGDSSKIREAVSLSLIQQTATSLQEAPMHPQEFAFCEVFINGQYSGLYQLTEAMDAKQLDMNLSTDILYKSEEFKYPSSESFLYLQNTNEEVLLGTIATYAPKGMQSQKYNPLIDYFNSTVLAYENSTTSLSANDVARLQNSDIEKNLTLTQIEKITCVQNLIDTELFIALLCLTDNDPKNLIYVAYAQPDGSYRIHKELYDLNYALGDRYSTNPDTYTVAYSASANVAFRSICDSLSPTDRQLYIEQLCARYHELRATIFSKENIESTMQLYYQSIANSGAYAREYQTSRLNHLCAAAEYERLTSFIQEHLQYLDLYIRELSNEI